MSSQTPIESISKTKRNVVFDPWAAYSNTVQSSKVENMDNDDKKLAIAGLRFTQPDTLAYGTNPITSGRFGGLLNINGVYDQNGNAPKNTFSCIA